jgi:hypothetical protein
VYLRQASDRLGALRVFVKNSIDRLFFLSSVQLQGDRIQISFFIQKSGGHELHKGGLNNDAI